MSPEKSELNYQEALRFVRQGNYRRAQNLLVYYAHVHEPSDYLLRAVKRGQDIVVDTSMTEVIEEAYGTGKQALIAGNYQLAEQLLLQIAHFHEPARVLLRSAPASKLNRSSSNSPVNFLVGTAGGFVLVFLVIVFLVALLANLGNDKTATTTRPTTPTRRAVATTVLATATPRILPPYDAAELAVLTQTVMSGLDLPINRITFGSATVTVDAPQKNAAYDDDHIADYRLALVDAMAIGVVKIFEDYDTSVSTPSTILISFTEGTIKVLEISFTYQNARQYSTGQLTTAQFRNRLDVD